MKIFDIIPRQTNPERPEPFAEEVTQKPTDEETPTVQRARDERFEALEVLSSKEQRPPLKEELRRKIRWRTLAPAWIVLAGIIILGVVGALTFLYPRVTIAITAKKTQVPLELFLALDSRIQSPLSAEGKIPGKFITLSREETRTFPTTGKEKVTAKARGTVTIFNAFSAKPQTLVATTRFQAPDGKLFRLTKTTTVPGAAVEAGAIKPSSVTVGVEADKPGPTYNIGPTDFTVPGFKGSTKFTGFYGKSYAAMQGGAEGETPVAKETDLAEARRTLREELSTTLIGEITKGLAEGWQIFPEGITSEIVSANPSVSPGAAAAEFKMRFLLTVSAAAYRPGDLEHILTERANTVSEALPNQRARLLRFESRDLRIDERQKTLSAVIKADVELQAELEAQTLKLAILGKREAGLKEYLQNHAAVGTARVTFWPFWVKRVPKQENLVTVTID